MLAVFLWLWFYNRRKYHHLKHQIPASVVKNYLDSIIQNSTALKSSLFRGGGLEVDSNGVPSVMPLSELPSGAGAEVNLSSGKDDSALRAELAKLQAQLNEKNGIIKDLENRSAQLGGEVKAKQERIEELEKLLAAAQAESAGGDPEVGQKLAAFAALEDERDRLQEDLKQYEVISDDLADLKRLKQENVQLKKALEESGGSMPEEAAEEIAPEPEEKPEDKEEALEAEAAPEVEETEQEEEPAQALAQPEEEVEESAPAAEAVEEEPQPEEPAAQEASAEGDEANEEDDEDSKSPEDLLSEFEKMLG